MVFGNTLLATALSSDYLLFRRHLVALQDCLLHLLHTYPCSTDARFTRLSFEHYREWDITLLYHGEPKEHTEFCGGYG